MTKLSLKKWWKKERSGKVEEGGKGEEDLDAY
jgi:hypothetical protein